LASGWGLADVKKPIVAEPRLHQQAVDSLTLFNNKFTTFLTTFYAELPMIYNLLQPFTIAAVAASRERAAD